MQLVVFESCGYCLRYLDLDNVEMHVPSAWKSNVVTRKSMSGECCLMVVLEVFRLAACRRKKKEEEYRSKEEVEGTCSLAVLRQEAGHEYLPRTL